MKTPSGREVDLDELLDRVTDLETVVLEQGRERSPSALHRIEEAHQALMRRMRERARGGQE